MPNNLTIQIAVQGGAAAKQALAEIGRAVKDTAGQIDSANNSAGKAWGLLVSALARTREAFEPVGERLQGLRENVRRLGEQVNHVSENVLPNFKAALGIVALGSGAGLVELVKSSAEGVRETENLAAALGTTTEKLEAWQLLGRQSGVSTDALATGMSRFAAALGKAREEAFKAKGAIDDIVIKGGQGIADLGDAVDVIRGGRQQDFSNPWKALQIDPRAFKDTSDALVFAAEKLDRMRDSAIKAAIARELFGRGWREMIPAMINARHRLEEAEQQIKKWGLSVTEAERQQAKAFNSALGVTGFYFQRIREIVGNILGGAFVPAIEALAMAIGQNRQAIADWANQIAGTAKPAVEDLIALMRGASREQLKTDFAKGLVDALRQLSGVIGSVKAVFAGLMDALAGIAAAMNYAFGTHVTGQMLLIVALIGQMTGAFGLLFAALSTTVGAFRVLLAIGALITWPITLGIAIGALIGTMIDFNKSIEGMKILVGGLWEIFKAFVGWVEDKFVAAWNAATGAITRAAAALERFFGLSGSRGTGVAGVGSPAITPGFAGGGLARGPGSGTSDSIWARVSNGEFINTARSVAHWGAGIFHALNDPANFANGGPVGALMASFAPRPLRFAAGGMVPAAGGGGNTVNLHIGGERFTMSADDETAASLARFSRRRQVASAGPKSSWYTGTN